MGQGTIRIEWDEITRSQWTGLFSMIPNSCHIHTWGYGEAVRKHTNLNPRRGVIYKANIPIGLVQAFQRRYFMDTLQETFITRGLQWIAAKSEPEDQARATDMVKSYFSLKFGQKVRFLDVLKGTKESNQVRQSLGMTTLEQQSSVTYVNLRKDKSQICEDLGPQWKVNTRATNQVSVCDDNLSLDWVLSVYREATKACSLAVPSQQFVQTFIEANEDSSFAAHALICNDKRAAALMITHGQCASLLFSCATEGTISPSTQQDLIWAAIEKLQSMGVDSLDFNGINLYIADGMHALNEDASTPSSAQDLAP